MKPRLEPLPVEEWNDDARAALRDGMPGAADVFLSENPDAPRIPNVLATLMHNPALTGPWLRYNSVLLGAPTLDPRHRELMILRVAWRARANYEWLQHVRVGKPLGITDEEIEAISRGEPAPSWTSFETDLMAATDQLMDHHCIDDSTWARLAEELKPAQLMELVFVVGSYTCLAMAFNSFGLELDPDLDPAMSPVMPVPLERK
ncbi:MAG: carboxymuconolactone decarboxylase family protein [Candidatus Binatia bacterium]|nr:carboxymuconolactone decarboxylase family protein [Candidatus Binatia bacterium]